MSGSTESERLAALSERWRFYPGQRICGETVTIIIRPALVNKAA